MPVISNDKNKRSNIKQDLKEFNSQSLSTGAKKRTSSFFDACN